MSKKISIKQFLMNSGKFEKVYDCIEAIKSGKITISGKTVTNPNYFFNPKKFLIKIDGEKQKPIKKLYFLMNKPQGYISQKSPDEKNIYDIISESNIIPKSAASTLFVVGRLDKDTEGLIILTNDGRLAHKITRPEHEIAKGYYVVLAKPIDINKRKMLENGVQICVEHKIYKTRQCKVKYVGEKEVYISITEGKKRQIRKMVEAIGNKVEYLIRVSIGGLQLGSLKPGEIRQVSREEIIEKLVS